MDKDLQKLRRRDYFIAAFKLLAGVPSTKDTIAHEINIQSGKRSTTKNDLRYYSLDINTGEPALFIEGNAGAYVIIEKKPPIKSQGRYYDTPSLVTYFSSEPSKLKHHLINCTIPDNERDIPIVSINILKDLVNNGSEIPYKDIFEAIEADYIQYNRAKKRHQRFIKKSDNLVHSATSAVFTVQNRKAGTYDCYLYTHPKAELGFWLTPEMLENKAFRSFLIAFSTKTNAKPLTKAESKQHLNEVTENASSDFLINGRPSKRYIDNALGFSKIRKSIGSGVRFGLQQPFFLLSRIDKVKTLVGGIVTGTVGIATVFALALLTPGKLQLATLLTIGSAKTLGRDAFSKATKNVSRYISKILNNNSLAAIFAYNDYGNLFAKNKTPIGASFHRHIVLSAFYNNTKPLQTSSLSHMDFDTPLYTDEIAQRTQRHREQTVDGAHKAVFVEISSDENNQKQFVMTTNGKTQFFDVIPPKEKPDLSTQLSSEESVLLIPGKLGEKAMKPFYEANDHQLRAKREFAEQIQWSNPTSMATIPPAKRQRKPRP